MWTINKNTFVRLNKKNINQFHYSYRCFGKSRSKLFFKRDSKIDRTAKDKYKYRARSLIEQIIANNGSCKLDV